METTPTCRCFINTDDQSPDVEGRRSYPELQKCPLCEAAPDLLEALKAARCFIGDELEARQRSYLPTDEEGDLEYIGQAERAFEAVCAAIAKAEER